MDVFFTPIILHLHTFPSEVISIFMFLFCILGILGLLRLFGATGLYLYNITVMIAANIQVMKLASFGSIAEPVALGTVAFATVFLSTDILTEHYGKAVANRSVWLTFWAQILMTGIMMITLGHNPAPEDTAHKAMETLFLPSPRLLIASLVAFATSQLAEIALFHWMRQMTHDRFLWLRQNVSTACASLIDNILFSVLAWVVLSPAPVSFTTLVFTYILGTYAARILVSVVSTPVMYISYYCLPKKEAKNAIFL